MGGPEDKAFDAFKEAQEKWEALEAQRQAAMEQLKEAQNGGLVNVSQGIMSNIKGILADKDLCAAIIAGGIASGETYLLFKTETPEIAVGQLGAVAQGVGSTVSGAASALTNLIPKG